MSKTLKYGIVFLAGALIVIETLLWTKRSVEQGKTDSLMGVWKYDEYTKYEFDGKENGCLRFEELQYEFTYSIKDDVLKMDFADPAVHDCEYTFSTNGNSLTLIGGEGTSGGTYSLEKE